MGIDQSPAFTGGSSASKGARKQDEARAISSPVFNCRASAGGTPVRGTVSRRRQVSWLAGHYVGSGLPGSFAKKPVAQYGTAAHRLQLRGQRRTPPEGATGFPS